MLARFLLRNLKRTAVNWRTAHAIERRNPGAKITLPVSLLCDCLEAVALGPQVTIGAFCEIVVLQSNFSSRIPGSLTIGTCTVIGAWGNIRAAGGAVAIGVDCLVGQNVTMVAANHSIDSRDVYWKLPADESKTGVRIGNNCWIGAGAILLPGCVIGDNAVIAAGAVVNRAVPANEIWGAIPARPIGRVQPAAPLSLS